MDKPDLGLHGIDLQRSSPGRIAERVCNGHRIEHMLAKANPPPQSGHLLAAANKCLYTFAIRSDIHAA